MERIIHKVIDEKTQREIITFKMPSGVIIIPDECAHPEFSYILQQFAKAEDELYELRRKLEMAIETIDIIQEQLERGTFYDYYVDEAISKWEEFV